jgi:hypothetical protein
MMEVPLVECVNFRLIESVCIRVAWSKMPEEADVLTLVGLKAFVSVSHGAKCRKR